jgi:hypothetical protein
MVLLLRVLCAVCCPWLARLPSPREKRSLHYISHDNLRRSGITCTSALNTDVNVSEAISSANNRVCRPRVCSDSPLWALEYCRDLHSQIQRKSPTYSHSLNGARTLHCSSRAGDQGSVDHAMHANIGLMASYRPIRGLVTTKQTSQVPLPEAHLTTTGVRSRVRLSPQPKSDRRSQCPVRSLGQPIESVHVHVFVVVWIIYMHCRVSEEENINS